MSNCKCKYKCKAVVYVTIDKVPGFNPKLTLVMEGNSPMPQHSHCWRGAVAILASCTPWLHRLYNCCDTTWTTGNSNTKQWNICCASAIIATACFLKCRSTLKGMLFMLGLLGPPLFSLAFGDDIYVYYCEIPAFLYRNGTASECPFLKIGLMKRVIK